MDAVSKFALFFYVYIYIYIVILTFCCIYVYIYIQNKTKNRMSGFCVLLFGTMVYNEILSLESLGIYYPEKDLQESLLPSKSMKKKKTVTRFSCRAQNQHRKKPFLNKKMPTKKMHWINCSSNS